jgi:hypothetical protein
VREQFALGIRQRGLLRKVSQDAQPVGAGIDHEIDAAALADEVEHADLVEGRRHHRKDSAIRRSHRNAAAGLVLVVGAPGAHRRT